MFIMTLFITITIITAIMITSLEIIIEKRNKTVKISISSILPVKVLVI